MSVENLVARAKAAYRANRKAEARTLLLEAVQQDPNHEDAWLWLSGMVETLEDQQICLENVLALNPMHQRARKGLEAVERKLAEQVAPQPARAPEPEPDADWGAPATSVEWGKDGGPAAYGSGKQVDLPTHEEYDAWVSELHLDGSAGNPAASATPPFIMDTPSPFGDMAYLHDSTPFMGDSPLMAVRSQPEPDNAWPSVSRSDAPAEPARVWPAPAREAPPAAPASRAPRNEFSFDDDEPTPPRAPQPVAARVSAAQPMPAAPSVPAPASPKATAPQTEPLPASGQDRYFAYIPADVTSDRARRRSRALTLALVLLLLANLAAVAALISAL